MKTKEKQTLNEKKRVIEVKKQEVAPDRLKVLWSEAVAELKSQKFVGEEEMVQAVVELVASKASGGEEMRNFLATVLSTDPRAMEVLRRELL
jgi:ABC-type glutathione transport system ATPase component